MNQLDLSPRCDQNGCEQPAAYRYEWLGEPKRICEQHRAPLLNVADALGVRVDLQPIGGAR